MSELVCPKCQSPMRSYERSGVTVDQCSGCRGVFLDRGELERLIDAEGDYYEGGRSLAREPEPEREYREEREYQREHGHQKPHKKRKKESFLSDLLDF